MAEPNFEKMGGLIPAIIQDARTGQVLMLGYMNQEALDKTHSTGLVTFYSRSRGELWTKGETSGNRLHLESISADCDGDALLISAVPDGPVCHEGTRTCFTDDVRGAFGFLGALEAVIVERTRSGDEASYTARLLEAGPPEIARKVGEEAVETIVAYLSEPSERLGEESADLLYHLLVLLRSKGVGLRDLVEILHSRHQPDGED